MKRTLRWAIPVVMMALAAAGVAGTLGVFQGKIVNPQAGNEPGWIFVQARNGNARRVDITSAKFTVSKELPDDVRELGAKDLRAGMQVLITAEQTADGYWRATSVEILSVPGVAAKKQPDEERH